MFNHLITHKKYSSTSVKNIDWNAIERVGNTLPFSKQIWLTKHVSGFCATATTMFRRHLWTTDKCPLCGNASEDICHVITCPDDRARKQYHRSIKRFIRFLNHSHTHPTIIHIFTSAFQNHLPSLFISHIPLNETDRMFTVAAQEQDDVGWSNIFKGHLVKSWSIIQLKYYYSMYHNPPSIYNWSTAIISHLYDVSHDMRTHRNGIVHQKVAQSLNAQELQGHHSNITHQYHLGSTSVLLMHQDMFHETLHTLLSKSADDKKYWLLTIQASRLCVHRTSTSPPLTNDE